MQPKAKAEFSATLGATTMMVNAVEGAHNLEAIRALGQQLVHCHVLRMYLQWLSPAQYRCPSINRYTGGASLNNSVVTVDH